MPKVYQRAAARRDLVEHFVYLGESAGIDTAERLFSRAPKPASTIWLDSR